MLRYQSHSLFLVNLEICDMLCRKNITVVNFCVKKRILFPPSVVSGKTMPLRECHKTRWYINFSESKIRTQVQKVWHVKTQNWPSPFTQHSFQFIFNICFPFIVYYVHLTTRLNQTPIHSTINSFNMSTSPFHYKYCKSFHNQFISNVSLYIVN